MSKQIIQVNTNQGRYRVRRINYDRVANMPSDWWGYGAVIGGKSFKVYARHGGTVANKYGYPSRTSAVLAISCIDDDTTVVMGSQIPANKATQAGAAEACLCSALASPEIPRWVYDARWLWDRRASRQERKDKAWFTLVKAYETIVAREKAAA